MKNRQTRRLSLALLGMLLLPALAACGGAATTAAPGQATPAAQAPEQLVVWWWGEGGPISDSLDQFVAETTSAFGEQQGVQTVQPVRQGDTTIESFKAAAEAQEGPDIATIWYGIYQLEEVWANNVVPLDEYVPAEERQHWIGANLSTYDGKLWGGDLYAYGVTMMYNKELFAAAGLDPEKPPATWADLLAACDTLNAAGTRPIIWSFGGAGWGTAVISGFIWPQTLGGSLEPLKEAAMGNRSFTEPEFEGLFTHMDELNQRNCFGEDKLVDIDSATEFQSGNGAIAWAANFNAATVIEEMGADKVGLMYFPSISGEPVDWIQVAPITLFVTSWSGSPSYAAEYLKFLHTPAGFDLALSVGGGKIVPADDRFDTSQIENPTNRMLAEQIHGGFRQGTWFADSVLPYAILDGALPAGQKLVAGEITPAEAAQLTQDAAQRWRDENPEALENYKKWAASQ
jgi:ABC-type glycerol-3-phosphate transport system substrate-binding protein